MTVSSNEVPGNQPNPGVVTDDTSVEEGVQEQDSSKLVLDTKGYVWIQKDETRARVVPESLPVWTDRGWDLVPEDEVPNRAVPDEDKES